MIQLLFYKKGENDVLYLEYGIFVNDYFVGDIDFFWESVEIIIQKIYQYNV